MTKKGTMRGGEREVGLNFRYLSVIIHYYFSVGLPFDI